MSRTPSPLRGRRRGSSRLGRCAALALLLPALAVGAEPGAGQGPRALERCRAGGEVPDELCLRGVDAFRTGSGAILTALAGGSHLPGSPSTVGQRTPGRPRLALAAAVQGERVTLPALGRGDGPGSGDRSGTVGAVRGTAALGVFQGFGLRPLVGGILSVDLVASGTWVALPSSAGFDGDVAGIGAGARVGILRESFTLPGVTVSALWHRSGRVGLLSGGEGSAGSLRTEGWSVRGIVGKELGGVGVHAGVGADRAGGTLRLSPPDGGSAFVTRDLTADRELLLAGATWTFLVTQLSGEVGWAIAPEPLSRAGSGSSGSLLLGLSGRITF